MQYCSGAILRHFALILGSSQSVLHLGSRPQAWGLGVDFPIRVSSIGGGSEFKDDWETPDTQVVAMDFPGRVSLIWESRRSNGRKIEGQERGIIFYGEK